MRDFDRDMRDAARDAEQDGHDDRPTLAECEADERDDYDYAADHWAAHETSAAESCEALAANDPDHDWTWRRTIVGPEWYCNDCGVDREDHNGDPF